MKKSQKNILKVQGFAVSPMAVGGRRRALLPLGAAFAAGLFVVTQAAFAEEQTLPAVTVKANAEQQDGYRASKTRVGKVVQDPHDVPQAITTITCLPWASCASGWISRARWACRWNCRIW